MSKPKYVNLRGNRKKLACRCPKCGHAKQLDARKGKKGWRICGASEAIALTSDKPGG